MDEGTAVLHICRLFGQSCARLAGIVPSPIRERSRAFSRSLGNVIMIQRVAIHDTGGLRKTVHKSIETNRPARARRLPLAFSRPLRGS